MSERSENESPPGAPVAPARRPAPLLRCLAIVAIPALMLIWGKLKLIERGGGLLHPPAGVFSPLQQLAFFRADLLAALLVIPAATLLLARVLGRWRGPVLAILSVAAVWVLAMEFQTHKVIGRFLSLYLIEDTLRFGWKQRDIAGMYVSTSAVMKPAVTSLVVLAAAWWATRTLAVPPVQPRWRWRSAIVAAAVGVPLAVTALAWGPWDVPPALRRGVVWRLVSAMREPDVRDRQASLIGLTDQQLIRRFRAATRSPRRLDHPPHFGAAAGCDVIFIVLETAPASVADTLSDAEMPNLARLKQRGWVARRHHSTYPFTSFAMWSILTSWYPSNAQYNYPQQAPGRTYPGVMQSLKSAGYATALYIPDEFTAAVDQVMYQQAGVDHHYYAYDQVTAEMKGKPAYLAPRGAVKARDELALGRLLGDITQWTGKNQRYIAHFAPQFGHAPWANLTGGKAPHALERGRDVLKVQDAYIGRIIDHLRSLGRFDNTIILVTGDHGIRTWREDPAFVAGMLSDYSFRVPLTLYCPPMLKQRVDIPWLTSHIDIAPSVLDLLGVSQGRASEQGSPLWDQRLKDRITFFFARNYLGADGYHADGTFYMWRPVEDVVYQSGRLEFTYANAISGENDRDEIKERLLDMAAFQKEWLRLAPARSTGAAGN